MADVSRDLVALHATDPSSVFLAARARLRRPSVAAIENALYAQRSVVPGTDEARVHLVRRWPAAFGPAPVADITWGTGLTVGQVKRALADIAPAAVDLDGTPVSMRH